MAVDWQGYIARINAEGSTLKDRVANEAKTNLAAQIANSPASQIFTKGSTSYTLLTSSTNVGSVRTFTTVLSGTNTLNIGDLLTIGDQHWLVTDVEFESKIALSGKIEWCNYLCQFQNWTSTVITCWGIFKDPSSETIAEGDKISVPSGKTTIILPANADTKKIHINKRLITETAYDDSGTLIPVVYKVNHVDTISSKYGTGSLLKLTVEYDNHQKMDSITYMVANYIAPVITPEPVVSALLPCKIVGKSTVLLGGNARKYTAFFYKADKITQDLTINAVFSVVFSNVLAQGALSIVEGNTISISVPDKDIYIGETFTVTLTDDHGLYQASTLTGMVVTL